MLCAMPRYEQQTTIEQTTFEPQLLFEVSTAGPRITGKYVVCQVNQLHSMSSATARSTKKDEQMINTHFTSENEGWINNGSAHCAIVGVNNHNGVIKCPNVKPLEVSSIVPHLAVTPPFMRPIPLLFRSLVYHPVSPPRPLMLAAQFLPLGLTQPLMRRQAGTSHSTWLRSPRVRHHGAGHGGFKAILYSRYSRHIAPRLTRYSAITSAHPSPRPEDGQYSRQSRHLASHPPWLRSAGGDASNTRASTRHAPVEQGAGVKHSSQNIRQDNDITPLAYGVRQTASEQDRDAIELDRVNADTHRCASSCDCKDGPFVLSVPTITPPLSQGFHDTNLTSSRPTPAPTPLPLPRQAAFDGKTNTGLADTFNSPPVAGF